MRFDELPTKDRGGRPMTVKNALISSVSLTTADHGVLTGWLYLGWDGAGCGFGGYCLGRLDGRGLRGGRDYAAEWVVRCCRVGGSETWEGLKGRPVRVLSEGPGGGLAAVGHYLKDDWFCPQIEWKERP